MFVVVMHLYLLLLFFFVACLLSTSSSSLLLSLFSFFVYLQRHLGHELAIVHGLCLRRPMSTAPALPLARVLQLQSVLHLADGGVYTHLLPRGKDGRLNLIIFFILFYVC